MEETAADADRSLLRAAGKDFDFATCFFFTRVFVAIEIPTPWLKVLTAKLQDIR
jgi:hypothetical protein